MCRRASFWGVCRRASFWGVANALALSSDGYLMIVQVGKRGPVRKEQSLAHVRAEGATHPARLAADAHRDLLALGILPPLGLADLRQLREDLGFVLHERRELVAAEQAIARDVVPTRAWD